MTLEDVQSRLEAQKSEVDEQVVVLETDLDAIKEEMAGLKVRLKSKFGDSINLDN